MSRILIFTRDRDGLKMRTTKGVGKGTGLGLAIARQIIVENGIISSADEE
jgi:signal transduction histidine kinase